MAEHGALIYNLGLSFYGDEDETQDLFQDVFLLALKNWEPTVRTRVYRARLLLRRERTIP